MSEEIYNKIYNYIYNIKDLDNYEFYIKMKELIYSFNNSWDTKFIENAALEIYYLRRLSKKDNKEIEELAKFIYNYVVV